MVSDLLIFSLKPGVPKEHYKKFCLGLPDWCACCTGDELCMAENNPNVTVLKNKERESKSLQLKPSRVATKTVPLQQKKVKNYNERFFMMLPLNSLMHCIQGGGLSNQHSINY